MSNLTSPEPTVPPATDAADDVTMDDEAEVPSVEQDTPGDVVTEDVIKEDEITFSRG